MIPKTIHYCWLSGDRMPRQAIRCMKSWKTIMPDYQIVHWDTEKFDITGNLFVQEACSVKKWPFAADYIRLYALYTEGGIYLDCDVVVKRRFDDFLHNGVFTSLEYNQNTVRSQGTLSMLHPDGTSKEPHTKKPGIAIQAAVIAAEKGHPFIRKCLDWYQGKHFILDDGSYNDSVIAPAIYAMVAEDYGFRYTDVKQTLRENILVLPSEYFPTWLQATENSYALHLCASSWLERGPWRRATERAKRNNLVRRLFRKKVVRPFA